MKPLGISIDPSGPDNEDWFNTPMWQRRPGVPSAPRVMLPNGQMVYLGMVLTHDRLLRVLRQRVMDLIVAQMFMFHYPTPHRNADGTTSWWEGGS